MNKLKIYLSGACKNVDDDFQHWREDFENSLHYYEDFTVIDPIAHFDYTNRLPKTNKACHDLFYYYIDKSNLLVVNLDDSEKSPGTVAEVHHAYMLNIPVIGFGKNLSTWYQWTVEECSVILDNINEVIEYINLHYYL